MEDIRKHTSLLQLKNMFFYTFGIIPLDYYNARGDGITDNRLQLQQAINDAITAGIKYIFVPKGEYYYSNNLNRKDEVIWIGNNADSSIAGVTIRQFPDLWNESQAIANSLNPIGTIVLHAGEAIPENYLECNGATLNRVEYSSLFEAIGTADEKSNIEGTTFVLPTATSTIARTKYIIRAR